MAVDSRELKEKMKTWEYERLSKSHISLRKKLIDADNLSSTHILEERINLIKEEWVSRKSSENREYLSQSDGLLSAMGYKVGMDGLKPLTRQKILTDVISGPIPLVNNPSYMEEWGEDGSSKRIKKTFNCLMAFSSAKIHETHHEALKDWSEDIEWLENNFER